MTRALIIEDEPKAARVLSKLIHQFLPDIGELQIADSGQDGLVKLGRFQPQLVFLDIEMPGMDGFEFLELAQQGNFAVIFTTAFDQYAIKAIRYSALDYLLKPVDPDELQQAYQRFLLQEAHTPAKRAQYQNLLNNLNSGDERSFKLSIATTEGTHFLSADHIVRCQADRNYTHFFQSNGQRLLASRPLNEYEALLADQQFLRVHRSHLVNLQHLVRWHDGQLILSDQSTVPISRRKRTEVGAILKGLGHS